MSLIPLDEQRGGGPSAPDASPSDSALLGRLLAGVKVVVLAIPGVSSLASESSGSAAAPAGDTEREESPERKAPATLPAGTRDGQVDVVTTESDDVLTVEAVDNPEATISSDTWQAVER